MKRLLTLHPLLTFLILCLSGLGFALASYNLFFLIKANLASLAEHGRLAVREGAWIQLLELLAHGILAGGCYVLFKACEKALVDKLLK